MGADICIENARIVDGTGAPAYHGSVLINNNHVSALNRRTDHGLSAEQHIDANRKVVCPGFIDLHSHADQQLFADPTLEPKIRQGVTTEILGQDGFSSAPVVPAERIPSWSTYLSGFNIGRTDDTCYWERTADFLTAVERTGVAPNVATLVGHGTIRHSVIGWDANLGSDELDRMGDLVDEALDDGAIGFSTGLEYSPQLQATTAEVRALVSRLEPYGRPFVAHIRSYGNNMWEALDEFIDIGRDEGVPLHLSHFKLNESVKGQHERALHLVAAARERGVDITADLYPYRPGSGALLTLLPTWTHVDGPKRLIERISDPEVREEIKDETTDRDWSTVRISHVNSNNNAPYVGTTVDAAASTEGIHPVDFVCDLLVDEELAVTSIGGDCRESDIRNVITDASVAIGSDGLFGRHPHPRTYGTFPQLLGRYVREDNELKLESAIRKMTSLAARVVGFADRGVLRPGMKADLVVFDPDTVAARATFDRPKEAPVGITQVLINGEFVVRDGAVTGNTPGEVIRG